MSNWFLVFVSLLTLLGASKGVAGEGKFVTKWQGQNGTEIKVPIHGKFKVTVKYSDGNVFVPEVSKEITDLRTPFSFTPDKNDTYTVEVEAEGGLYFRMKEGPTTYGSPKALLSVEKFGSTAWTTMENAFRDCENLVLAPECDAPNLAAVKNISYMFGGCKKFNSALDEWDVSHVIKMSYVFEDCKEFNSSIKKWDVSKVESMQGMFAGCSKFNQPLNDWGTKLGKVTDMQYMFNFCSLFNQSLNNWDVSGVKNMRSMFYRCAAFNGDISSWNVGQVNNMASMFEECSSFDQNIGGWKIKDLPTLDGTGMSPTNYDAILNAWKDLPISNKTFSVKGLVYTDAGKEAREHLKTTKGWTFTGDALDSETITLLPRNISCTLNKTVTLTLSKGSNLNGKKVTFAGEGGVIEKVEDVIADGTSQITLTSKKLGVITLTATCGEGSDAKKATCRVEVMNKLVNSITFAPTTLEKNVGDEDFTLNPTVLPEDASNPTLAWTSSVPSVATVDNGKVTIKSKGTTVITAKSTDGSNSEGSLTLTVKSYDVTGVKILKDDQEVTEFSVTEGESFTLKAEVQPNTTPGGVEWKSEDTQFTATDVDTQKATFKALLKGTYTIKAQAKMDLTKEGSVTVKVSPKVTAIAIYDKLTNLQVEPNVEMTVGGEKELEVRFTPDDATALEVTWTATVENQATDAVTVTNGKVVAAKPVENCKIEAQVTIPSTAEVLKASFILKVKEQELVAPTSLTIAKAAVSVEAGKEEKIALTFVGTGNIDKTVTVAPATNEYFDAKVENDQLVITAKKETTAALTVTVTSKKNPTATVTCAVTVTKAGGAPQPSDETVAPTSLTIAKAAVSVEAGKEEKIALTFVGTGNIDKTVTVAPATNEYFDAKVENDQLVITAKKETTAALTVTVTSKKNPTATVTCAVTVTKAGGAPQPSDETVAPTSLTIAKAAVSVEAGKEEKIALTFVGTGNIDKTVTVAPATNEYFDAKVENDQLVIKAKKETTTAVTVTVTSKKNTSAKVTCAVTVTKAGGAPQPGGEDNETFKIDLTIIGSGSLAIKDYAGAQLDAVKKGTVLEVIATPDPGFKLEALIANADDILETKKFTVTSAVTVKATFSEINAVDDPVLAGIAVAPNPFGAQLRITNTATADVTYELLTATGVVVRSGVLVNSEECVATETLPAGIYFVRFKGENRATKTLRVVKY